MAAHTRETAGVIAHSDHGSQYTSLAYGSHAKESGIDLSMGSVGDPWDNALAETFFASLEKELLKRERFTTREHARMRIFWYIECFYNPRRRHSSLDMLSTNRTMKNSTHPQPPEPRNPIPTKPGTLRDVNQNGSTPKGRGDAASLAAAAPPAASVRAVITIPDIKRNQSRGLIYA